MSASDEAKRIIEMWRRWREKNGTIIAKNSLQAFRSSFTTYIKWMHDNKYPIASMDRDKWVAYCNFITETDIANEYKRHKLRITGTILHFLFDMNALKEFDTSKPRRVTMKTSSNDSPLPLIPVYKDIQELRRTEMRIEDAMLFEVAISSGLRNNELRTVRMCDINFNGKPKDVTTNAPSIYCGGSVTVSTVVASTKGKRDRLTYISPLAAKLVRLYARVNGVNLDSQIPLIISERRLTFAIRVLNTNIEWVASRSKGVPSIKTAVPKPNDEEFMSLPTVMRKSYMARVKREAEAIHSPSGRREGDWITCHSMRYFFASAMLHRTYSGHRESIDHVSALLGHASVEMTRQYIKTYTAVESDVDWTHIMNGTSSSWLNVSLNKIDDAREWTSERDADWRLKKRTPLQLQG